MAVIDVNKPLYAKIFDFDNAIYEDGCNYIIRQVETIEFSGKRHNEPIIWFSGGFKSSSFELLEQNEQEGAE